VLRRRSGEIHVDAISGDLDRHAQLEIAVGRLHRLGREIATVGHGGDGRPRASLGIVEHRPAGVPEPIDAALRAQLPHPALGEAMHRELRVQVAPALVAHARVGDDQLEHVRVHAGPRRDPRRRDDQALLVQVRRVGRHARGRHAANVRMMRPRRSEADQQAVDVDRRDERDVGQVRAARVRIVQAPDLACLGPARDDGGDRGRQGAEVNRDVLSLDDERAVRVEQRRRAVATLLDVRREGAAREGCAHLLGDAAQRAHRHLKLSRLHA
jgi:hypothetical protein